MRQVLVVCLEHVIYACQIMLSCLSMLYYRGDFFYQYQLGETASREEVKTKRRACWVHEL